MKSYREYRELERELLSERKHLLLTLEEGDFRDGHLTVSGYSKLKKDSDYIPSEEQLKIIVPHQYFASFRDSLEYLAADELRLIKKTKQNILLTGIICLLVGVALLFARQFYGRDEAVGFVSFLGDLTLVAAWVFLWTAVLKFFFDPWALRKTRLDILQILCAEVVDSANAVVTDALVVFEIGDGGEQE